MADRPLLIQVVGDSASGKTLVVERCVRRLAARGLAVAVAKHSHHAPDLRGPSPSRAAHAGARVVVFDGRRSFLTFRGTPLPWLRCLPVDVVLVEGYSRHRFGSSRYTIRSPSEAPALVRRILAEAPVRTQVATVVLDGKRTRADPAWQFVANLMASRHVREVRADA